jgi:hypothetical protein
MLVIAKYNEDISWIKNVDIPYIIYNKGNKPIEGCNIISLPNIGRESHTYLSFIIENYYNLPENIIFCQGDPFPHCNNFLDLIKNYNINQDIINLSHGMVTEDLEGRPNAYGYGMLDMLHLLNIPLTVDKFIFPAGAQFTINKKCIINKSLNWWENSLSEHDKNQLSPWIFERLWPLIFTHSNI